MIPLQYRHSGSVELVFWPYPSTQPQNPTWYNIFTTPYPGMFLGLTSGNMIWKLRSWCCWVLTTCAMVQYVPWWSSGWKFGEVRKFRTHGDRKIDRHTGRQILHCSGHMAEFLVLHAVTTILHAVWWFRQLRCSVQPAWDVGGFMPFQVSRDQGLLLHMTCGGFSRAISQHFRTACGDVFSKNQGISSDGTYFFFALKIVEPDSVNISM